MKKVAWFLRRFPLEAMVWLVGLSALAVSAPLDHHYTVCPVAALGFDFCPGCGLGRSISFLFRGDLTASFNTHPLGLFAVIVLSLRIITLTKQHLKSHGQDL